MSLSAGNSIGKQLVFTCFGESHGKCVGAVIDGCPAGLPFSDDDVQKELDRRVPPTREIVSARIEKDRAEILSGVFAGHTTGAPLCILTRNRDASSGVYKKFADLPRPGHADFTARTRYGGFNDYRGGGRFSGRMTVAFVIAGAVAKKLLKLLNVDVSAYTLSIGGIRLEKEPTAQEVTHRYDNSVRCPDADCARKMVQAIIEAKNEGDSLGGIIQCVASNVPAGVGEPIFDSLDADIAKMLFNIPAVKGVEVGAGFGAAEMKGSEFNDAYRVEKGKVVTLTNNSGGILGGISSGMPISVRVAMKPTPSIKKNQKTVNLSTMRETTIAFEGRHDPCIVPKAVPVVEASIALVLADHMLRAGVLPKVLKGEI
jgi:chorismate synthase